MHAGGKPKAPARSGEAEQATEVPRVALATVVACIATATAAIYIETGPLLAVPIVGAAVVALVAWLSTSFRHPGESDRVVVLYISGIVALTIEHTEQWRSRAPELVMQLASGWAAPGFVFNEKLLIAGFAIASPALFLLGGFYLVRRQPLGDYMAWLLFAWSLVAGLLQGALAVSRPDALGVAVGIATCVPPLLLGGLGARRLILSSRALSVTVMP
jgi:hypothetical protein